MAQPINAKRIQKDPLFTRLGEREHSLFLTALAAFFLLWASFSLTALFSGDSESLDRNLFLSLRHEIDPADPLGAEWFEETIRDITALGSMAILALITLSVAFFLLLRQKTKAAIALLLTVGGGNAAALFLKGIVGRPRPEFSAYADFFSTSSFPSGHSMMAAVTYFTLATLLMRVEKSRRMKAYYFFLALVLTVMVGISRVYLGMHWPSDVLAGWSLGMAWAFAVYLIIERMQRRGKLESA